VSNALDQAEVEKTLTARFSPAKPRGPRLPLKALDDRGRRLVDLMTYGPTEDEAAEHGFEPHKPLALESAACVVGLKLKNARFIFSQKVFLNEYSANLAAIRNGAKARAVSTLCDMMDEPGDGSAASRAVRVKASTVLLGDEQGKGGGVTVNVTTQLTAGVVVRLPDRAARTPLELQQPQPPRLPLRRGPDMQERCLPIDENDNGDDFGGEAA